jgi:prepilin peptidase CpaA
MHNLYPNLILPITLITLVLATCEDFVRHRISNALVVFALALGLIANIVATGWSGLGTALLGMLAGMAMLFPLYFAKGLAAGDVKLMGALGSLLGPAAIVMAGVFTLIAGGVLGVIYLLWRVAGEANISGHVTSFLALTWRSNLADIGKERFPYALAISAGTLFALWRQGSLDFSAMLAGSGT